MLGNIQREISELLSIEISPDKMQATLLIKTPEDGMDALLSPLKLYNILDRAGVKIGLDRRIIEKILQEKLWDEKFLIAEGTKPVEGASAVIEFYFQTDISLRPKINEFGYVDYKDVCGISSVEKNAILLKKIPAGKGLPGRDIEGNELSAQKGKDILINAGKGTYWDQEDDTILRAAYDGIIFYNPQNHKVEVQQVFVIPGSVDYSTGNINVKSIVEIKGDVKPGFTVISPYNVFVKGVVEQGFISCDGCLRVGSGIIGNNNYIIRVGGDLHSGYINNQHVICDGSVYVSTEIRKSRIECNNDVIVEKNHGIIIGGLTKAARKVSAAYIGNSYGVSTEITVGVNSQIGEILSQKIEERAEMENHLKKLLNQITTVAQTSPPTVFETHLQIFKKHWNEINNRCEKVKAEINNLETEYYSVEGPSVEIARTIFHGTVINIKRATYEVKEDLSSVKFVLEDNQIVIKPLSH